MKNVNKAILGASLLGISGATAFYLLKKNNKEEMIYAPISEQETEEFHQFVPETVTEKPQLQILFVMAMPNGSVNAGQEINIHSKIRNLGMQTQKFIMYVQFISDFGLDYESSKVFVERILPNEDIESFIITEIPYVSSRRFAVKLIVQDNENHIIDEFTKDDELIMVQ